MTKKQIKTKKWWEYLKIILVTFLIVSLIYDVLFTTLGSKKNVLKNIDTPIDKISLGKIAYNIPEEMQLQEDTRVVVLITKSLVDSALRKDIDTSTFRIQTIKVATRIKANLVDPTRKCFGINSLSTEEQFLDDSTNTFWEWDVKPIKSGRNKLILKATIKVNSSLGDNYRDIPIFEKVVYVKSSFITSTKIFIKDYWQWLTTVLLLPFGIWIYNKVNRRIKEKKNKPKPIGFNKNGT